MILIEEEFTHVIDDLGLPWNDDEPLQTRRCDTRDRRGYGDVPQRRHRDEKRRPNE
jgi:hypothetical protein